MTPAAWTAAAALAACVAAPVRATETCTASVYWEGCCLASGGRYHPDVPLVAHKTLPFHTMVRVTVISTGASRDLPVLDRGPFIRGRCIDLSRGAARLLGVSGLARVTVEVVASQSPARRSPVPPSVAVVAGFDERLHQ